MMAENLWRLGDVEYMTFPFKVGEDGHVRTSRRQDHVRQQIAQVLYTHPGERVFRPDFGAGVRELLFEPHNTALREMTQKRLLQSLAQALHGEVDPQTLSVTIDPDELDEKLVIVVEYQLAAINESVKDVFRVPGGTNG